jgi:ribosome-binding protein aMBF1 (putative translation factor)
MSNYTISPTQNQQIPVTGELKREPLCEICGDPHPQPVTVLDHGPLQLCQTCRRVFGFDQAGQRGQDGSIF